MRNLEPPEDLKQRAERDEIVARMSGLRTSRSYVEQTYGGEWDDAAPAPPGGPEFAGGDARRDDDAVRDLAGEADDESRQAQDALVDVVRELAMSARSMEDVRDGLLALYPDMETGPLAGAMREALAVANLMGRSDLSDGR